MQMKRFSRYIFFLLLLLGAAGCSKEPSSEGPLERQVGYLSTSFGLNADQRTTTPGGTQSGSLSGALAATKAAVDPENFWIKVKDITSQQYVYQSLKNKIADLLELEVGVYEIEVSYPEKQDDAAFEQPHFYGKTTAPVTIFKDQITQVTSIDATMQNMKVTVVFKDEVFNRFSEFKAVISNGKGALEYTKYTSEAGYFTVSALTVSFWGKRQETGDELEKQFETQITNVGAAFHHNIVIDAKFAYPPATKGIPQASAQESGRLDHYFVIE